MGEIKLWDPFVRLNHWLLASLFILEYWILTGGEEPHEWVGYFAGGLVLARVTWGFIGPKTAQFRYFFPTPSRLYRYFKEPKNRYNPTQGHNPLAGLMILFLLSLMLTTAITGWMQELDRFWGEAWVQDLHEYLANILVGAVALHITAIVLIQRKTGIPLIKPMITGKRKVSTTERGESHVR
jgi:cytochrome b